MAKNSKATKGDIKGTVKCARVPIVTILGHVDHGKTTILDNIRKSNVQECEAGGITQRVSVFTVDLGNDKRVTFVDTPGHEAFDLMRVRGGNIADIVLLVVAGDDGVKPQTKESIEIIKNSSAKPIVVINKCDLPDINLDKVKREIVNNGLQLEGYGGNIPVVEVSGKTGKGLNELLDLITLVADVDGLREEIDLPKGVTAQAFVLESIKDKFKGNISSVALIQGDMCQGSWFGYKTSDQFILEKVKGIITEEGENICLLDCGCGGKIIGLSHLLELGTEVYVLENKDEKLLKSLYKEDEKSLLEEEVDVTNFFSTEKEEEGGFLNVIVKSSSEGSLEAIKNSLMKIEEDGYTVKIVNAGVGSITLKDAEMAELSRSILLGFEVTIEKGVIDHAKKNRILVKTYDIIYKLIEEVKEAITIMSLPAETEEEIGGATVKTIFTLSDGTSILGSKVDKGFLKKDCKVYVVRNDEMIGESKIKTLRINKSSVNDVKVGFECGIQLNDKVDVKEGDQVFCYKVSK
ncbi:MAG: translation initiation factor IF-2 [Candidatus Dojkabacteria bacterium]